MKTFKVYSASGQIVAEIQADFFRVDSKGICFWCKSDISAAIAWFALASVWRIQEEGSLESKSFLRDPDTDDSEHLKISCGPK